MVKRRISPSETNIFEKSLTETKETSHRGATALAAVGGGLALSYLVSMGGAGEAHADNNIIFGGRNPEHVGDTSELYKQHLLETGQIKSTDHNFAVKYPEGMIPGLDPVSMRDSVDQAVATGQDILNTQADPVEKTNYFGYSLGGAPAIEMARKNPGRAAHIYLDKTGYGSPISLDKSPLAKDPDVQSLAQQYGFILSEPLPPGVPVTVNAAPGDAFSNGWHLKTFQEVMDELQTTFSSGSHDMSDPSQPHNTVRIGNVTINWYGNDPIPRFSIDQPNDLGPSTPPAPVPEAAPAPAPEAPAPAPDVPPAPEAAPAPEAPVLSEAVAPAPEAPASQN
jgi:hypothetical protein